MHIAWVQCILKQSCSNVRFMVLVILVSKQCEHAEKLVRWQLHARCNERAQMYVQESRLRPQVCHGLHQNILLDSRVVRVRFENFETHINCIYKAVSFEVVESQLVTDCW